VRQLRLLLKSPPPLKLQLWLLRHLTQLMLMIPTTKPHHRCQVRP
jgi:hypothetical protein